MGFPGKTTAGHSGLPRPPARARAHPALCVTCGLLQKSLPVSNGLVHVLLPVHNFLVQSLERKANWGYPSGRQVPESCRPVLARDAKQSADCSGRAREGWTTDLILVQSTFSCYGTYWDFWDPKAQILEQTYPNPLDMCYQRTCPCIRHNLTLEKSLHGPWGAEADGFLGGQPGSENPPGFSSSHSWKQRPAF